jgi:hypothetical protein
MKPLKSEIRKDATKMLSNSIDLIFQILHKKYNTLGGDISPMQQRILDNIIEELPYMISEQVFQNIDLEKVNLNNMTKDELIELAYSLDWNGSWDADEEGQEPITKEELIKAINDMIFQNY